jgi:6-phosphogluconate dehydrogenase
MLMVKAGPAVDALIEQLIPLLSPGDVIIDGGNTLYSDTERRTTYVESKGLLFLGTGVSGGEEGALHGPSIMPGGSEKAWPLVKPVFQAISAKVGPKNYFMLKHTLGLSNDELYDVFDEWNRGELDSYLIEITRDIFSVKDPDGSGHLVDAIMDTAGAKGTGKWMSQLALDLGVPSTLVTEAVYARCLSALKDSRVRASKVLKGPAGKFSGDRKAFIEAVRHALYASKICSYAQGFVQLQAAAKEHQWPLDYGSIAMLWRGGCIIRARFLDRIKEAFDADRNLENLLLAPYFTQAVEKAQPAWREVVGAAVQLGIPAPAFMTALAYFDGYRQARLPANLLQAQRDYFGAYTYQRTDKPGTFHSDWLNLRKKPS